MIVKDTCDVDKVIEQELHAGQLANVLAFGFKSPSLQHCNPRALSL